MSKQKLMEIIAVSGEILIIAGAAVWITGWVGSRFIFALGALLFATGRLFSEHEGKNGDVVLRRLYVQQNIGVVFALIAALLMFFYDRLNGIEVFDYVVRSTASAWLLPFFIFVVLEVYTTFRISSELKKEALELKNRQDKL